MEDDHKTKKDFKNFLSRTGLIRQDKIKYYVYWVIKFLNYCNYRPIKPLNQNIPPYLEQLEKDERIKEWQVKQAADTVRAKRRLKLPVVLSREEEAGWVEEEVTLNPDFLVLNPVHFVLKDKKWTLYGHPGTLRPIKKLTQLLHYQRIKGNLQEVARLTGSQEVVGSIPISSTIFCSLFSPILVFLCFEFYS